jgi:hypothetical protein
VPLKSTLRKATKNYAKWEIIADNLSKAGWSLGWVSALDLEARTIWIVDAHGYGKRFIVRADEILTAFVELESAARQSRKIWALR